ncbi:MAG: hypothetical protein HYV45_03475 [Candidatus Moranbacteria bacterium]|nr:hypothetical protein [Candidatus Moranbacteria bacterium]
MEQKSSIIFIVFLLVFSTMFLFWQNERELDPNYEKNWWTLAFAEPQNITDLSFVVENYTDNADFSYEVVRDKQVLEKKSFTLKRGERKNISLSIRNDVSSRTSVMVRNGKEKKEIYR